ncbi:MAG: thioredoxin family protein [Pirellulales bacterium]|nr:thioredoxin family protein [Pirellulales bacterium]
MLQKFVQVLAGVLICGFTCAAAADAETDSPVGSIAPRWSDLAGTDGELHGSTELDDAKATLVVFLCNRCPCAKGYEKRLIEFADQYADKGVKVVAFNCNPGDGESLEAMKERADDSGFNFVYLKDPEQKIGKAFAAKTTPHVFLLDADRKIVFSGAFDNDMRGKKITETYVVDAVEDLLASRAVKVNSSRLCGCSIKYQ